MDTPQIKELFNFTGKAVLVTGAGSGIGKFIVKRFADAGAQVIVNYLTSEGGAQTVVNSIESNGGQAVAFGADVTRREEVERLIAYAVNTFGGIDVLINNAGVYPLASVIEMTDEEWESVIDVNLRSVFLCTQEVSNQMINQHRGGAIVNITSIEAENPAPRHSHYNAAKGGVLMFTRSSANELGSYGIRVNAVSPGLIWREGLDEAWPDGVVRYKKAVPLGRLGTPDDVADACIFLASSAARWITGANLVVDGGVMTSTVY